jgi:hypothetical protein
VHLQFGEGPARAERYFVPPGLMKPGSNDAADAFFLNNLGIPTGNGTIFGVDAILTY